MRTKAIFLILSLCTISLLTSCDKDSEYTYVQPETPEKPSSELPEGYFEVNFSTTAFESTTRAPVSGLDNRVQHIRYIIYKSTGEYVKEKVILVPAQGTPTWPLVAVRDTLPKGNYKAVFLGNIETTLFPYSSGSTEGLYTDVLTNYQTNFDDARIVLPPTEFTTGTEYYWANVSFSDTSPNPSVLLQRIIGATKLKRVFVDAEDALNSLVNNIVTQINYKDIIQTSVEGILPGKIKAALQSSTVGTFTWTLLGGIDAVTNTIVAALIAPVTNALYEQLLEKLVAEIGTALVGNTNEASLLAYLAVILNPWNDALAAAAIVTLNDFPRSIDFNLNVKEVYTGSQRFKYNITEEGNSRYVLIKGFNSDYDVQKINIVGQGLIAGVVVDQAIDEFLLPGMFVDINDPINVQGDKRNYRYYSDYAFLSLGLKSYTQQTDGNHSLTLSILIGDIPGIDDILGGIPLIGDILGLIISPIKAIIVETSVNLPLLGIDNLTLSGGWNPLPTPQY